MRVFRLVALGVVLVACGGDGPTPPAMRPSAIFIEPAVRSIVIGDTAKLSVSVVNAAGDTVVGSSARWSTSDTSVATVSAAGVVRGKAPGSVRIVAAVGGDTTSAGITVRKPAATLEVSRLLDTMMVGRQFRLFVTARDEAGSVVADAPLRWTSSDTTIFDVDETGWIRARSWGSGTLTIETESATFTRTVVVRIRQYGPTRRWGAVDAGDGNVCALTTDWEPMCWGNNTSGKLGYGGASTTSPQPVLGQHRFTSISTGFHHSCGIDADSTAWCWGNNGHGQLGTGARGSSTPEPQQVASDNRWKFIVAAGHGGTCAIAADDVPYCWGHNDFGQLGRPRQSTDPAILPWGNGPAARTISKDHFLSCLVLLNGEGWCAGTGAGSTTDMYAPPGEIAGRHRFRSIAVSQYHSCGATESGVTYCWGWFASPETGIVDKYEATPVPMQGGPDFSVLTAGLQHTCGLTAEGIAYCWGANQAGQLGSFHASVSAVPIRVSTPHRWRSISADRNATCGITPDDEMFCWGAGFNQ